MMDAQTANVQAAVNILLHTSTEILEQCVARDELARLTKVLKAVFRPKAKNRSADLLEAIQKILPIIWTFAESEAGKSCLLETQSEDDQRVTDIKNIEGKNQPTVEERLRQVSAQHSLATQFLQTQQYKNRVLEICNALLSSNTNKETLKNILQPGRNGPVSEFVREHIQLRSDCDVEIVSRNIHMGIKGLVLDTMFSKIMELKQKTKALSTVASFAKRAFKSLRYDEFLSFIRTLIEENTSIVLDGNKVERTLGTLFAVSRLCDKFHTNYHSKYGVRQYSTEQDQPSETNSALDEIEGHDATSMIDATENNGIEEPSPKRPCLNHENRGPGTTAYDLQYHLDNATGSLLNANHISDESALSQQPSIGRDFNSEAVSPQLTRPGTSFETIVAQCAMPTAFIDSQLYTNHISNTELGPAQQSSTSHDFNGTSFETIVAQFAMPTAFVDSQLRTNHISNTESGPAQQPSTGHRTHVF